MKHYKSIIYLTLFLLCNIPQRATARDNAVMPVTNLRDSVVITFSQSRWNLDRTIGNNASQLDSIDRKMNTIIGDSVYRLRHVGIYGGASPEGPAAFNRFLSEQRAATLFNEFDKYRELSQIEKTYTYYGRDWSGVLRLVERDPAVPFRDETITLLREIAKEKEACGGTEPPLSLERLTCLQGGVPYRYLYRHIFPLVRSSRVVLDYDLIPTPPA